MHQAPRSPRRCRCERHVLDGETCLLCGRPLRGRAPVQADWSGRMGDDWPRLETVLGLFGSLEAAVRVAGIDRSAR